VDKGDRAVALRPEMTPTLARMVGAHHRDYKKPIKWFAIPQLFRYEKQQRGRLREHFQFNADIIGETDVSADAELIALAIDTLRGFGLTENDFVMRISDRRVWQRYLSGAGIAEDMQYVAFQAIDKLEREPVEKTREKLAAAGLPIQKIEEILAIAEGKATADAPELQQVLGKLGDLAAYCKVDFKIVRGLAYYTGIVWEIHDRKGELRAVAGGGRYDGLLKQVSGVDLPALGFGMGDVVLGELLKDRGLLPKADWGLDCYIVIADETLRNEALKLIRELRDAGIAVDYALTETKVGKQFQVASASGARCALVIGPDEWKSGDVKLKDLASGAEQRIRTTDLTTKFTKNTKAP
jgi:histidyl-tRNA synthetase